MGPEGKRNLPVEIPERLCYKTLMVKIRTRFPPSPTGYLHIGGARTALFNWLFARQQGGTFVLRIEDTDVARSTEENTQVILEGLRWLGLDWDEGPFFQTQRLDLYRRYVGKLLDDGQAYYCHCTPELLEQKREQARAENRKPKYDGSCREQGLGPAPGAAVRLKAPRSGVTRLDDLIKGPVSFQNEELDDLVLARGDGMPTYHLAVVVDDITMDITHVIRGDDHVNNTPKQIQIYQALGQPLPQYGHVPMILGPDKTKLSKRHGAVSVLAYRDMGILPEALINTLVRLGWAHGDEEIFSREEMIAKFSLDQVGKSAGIFNPEKLLWLNSHYLKESSEEKLAGLVAPFIEARGYPADDISYLARVAGTLKARSKTLVEMAEAADFYFMEELSYAPEAAQKFFLREILPTLELLIQRLKDLPGWDHSALESVFQGLVDQTGLKMKQIAPPIRLALTGKTASPGLFEVMEVLGKAGTVGRIQRAIKFIQGV